MPGRRIGRYEILEEIGQGGMAVVYRAMDTILEREVALKLLHPHLASHIESRQRFLREAKAVARLKHPAVLEIYDYSDAEGDDIYIAMELVQGTSLRRFLDQRTGEPLCAEASALLMREVCLALAHAHKNGVVHRDVKPENILIGPKGEVKLSDFGIAHLAGLAQMTVTGQILGSPAYMSPEHIEHSELDARADIFSVGTVLYELAVGRKPFGGKNPHAIIKRIVEGDYDDPLSINAAIGPELARVLKKCLAPQPEKRYASADELVAELDSMLTTMGVTPSSETLQQFFQDPESWMHGRRPHIIDRSLALGLAAKRDRRLPNAVDYFNRVLALEPGNGRALAAVAGMSRQRRARRILEYIAVIVPILIAIGAVLVVLIRDEPSPNKPPAMGRNSNAARSPAKQLPQRPPKIAPTDAGPSDGAPQETKGRVMARIRPARAKAQENRVIVFTPSPMAVKISIDGGSPFAFGPASRKQIIPVGPHAIAFMPIDEKRFVPETWQVDIPPGDTPYYFRERLQWRPAKLVVDCNVPEAAVTVPGRAAGKVAAPVDVAIQKGPEEQIAVLVTAKGYIPETKQVTVGAGELVRVRVTLEKAEETVTSP